MLTDDKSSKNMDIEVNPTVLYLTDEKEQGIIRIDALNGITGSVHIATIPEMKGRAYKFAEEAKEWVFKNTQYMKIVAMVPVFNNLTINLAKRVGFKEEGVLKKSFLKNWKLHDQLILGLSKGE